MSIERLRQELVRLERPPEAAEQVLQALDEDSSGALDREEFKHAWQNHSELMATLFPEIIVEVEPEPLANRLSLGDSFPSAVAFKPTRSFRRSNTKRSRRVQPQLPPHASLNADPRSGRSPSARQRKLPDSKGAILFEKKNKRLRRISERRMTFLDELFDHAAAGKEEMDYEDLLRAFEDPDIGGDLAKNLHELAPKNIKRFYQALFRQLDISGDGSLDKSEFAYAFAELIDENLLYVHPDGLTGAALKTLGEFFHDTLEELEVAKEKHQNEKKQSHKLLQEREREAETNFEQMAVLDEKNGRLEQANKDLQHQIKESRDYTEELEDTIKRLDQEIKNADDGDPHADEALDRLEKELAKSRSELSNSLDEIQSQAQYITDLERQAAKHGEQWSEIRRRMSSYAESTSEGLPTGMMADERMRHASTTATGSSMSAEMMIIAMIDELKSIKAASNQLALEVNETCNTALHPALDGEAAAALITVADVAPTSPHGHDVFAPDVFAPLSERTTELATRNLEAEVRLLLEVACGLANKTTSLETTLQHSVVEAAEVARQHRTSLECSAVAAAEVAQQQEVVIKELTGQLDGAEFGSKDASSKIATLKSDVDALESRILQVRSELDTRMAELTGARAELDEMKASRSDLDRQGGVARSLVKVLQSKVAELTAQLEAMKTELARKHEEIEDAHSDVDSGLILVSELEADIKTARSSLESKEEELAQAKSRFDALLEESVAKARLLETELAGLTTSLALSGADLEAKTTELKNARSELEAEIEEARKQLDAQKEASFEQVQSLADQVADLTTQLKKAESGLARKTTELEAATARLETKDKVLKNLGNESTSDIKALKDEVAELKATASRLRADLEAKSSELDATRNKLEDELVQARAADQLRNKCSADEVRGLEGQIADLVAQLKQAQADISARLIELAAEKEHFDEFSESKAREAERTKSIEDQRLLLSTELVELTELVSTRDAELIKAECRVTLAEQRLNEAQSSIKRLQEQVAELSGLLEKTAAELGGANTEVLAIRTSLEDAQSRLSDSAQQLQQATENANTANAEVSALRSTLSATNAGSSAEVAALRSALETTQARLSDTGQQLSEMETTATFAKTKLVACKQGLGEMKEELRAVTGQCNNLKRQANVRKSGMDDLEAKCVDLEARLLDLKKQVAEQDSALYEKTQAAKDAQRNADTASRQVANLEEQVASMSECTKASQRRSSTAKLDASAEIASLNNALASKTAELEASKSRASLADSQLNMSQGILKDMQDMQAAAKATHQATLQELEGLAGSLAASAADVNAKTATIRELQELLDAQGAKLANTAAGAKQAEDQVGATNKQVEDLTEKIQSLTKECGELRTLADQHTGTKPLQDALIVFEQQVVGLNAKLVEMERILSQAHIDKSAMEAANATMEAELVQLGAELATKNAQLDSLRADFNAGTDQREQLTAKIESLSQLNATDTERVNALEAEKASLTAEQATCAARAEELREQLTGQSSRMQQLETEIYSQKEQHAIATQKLQGAQARKDDKTADDAQRTGELFRRQSDMLTNDISRLEAHAAQVLADLEAALAREQELKLHAKELTAKLEEAEGRQQDMAEGVKLTAHEKTQLKVCVAELNQEKAQLEVRLDELQAEAQVQAARYEESRELASVLARENESMSTSLSMQSSKNDEESQQLNQQVKELKNQLVGAQSSLRESQDKFVHADEVSQQLNRRVNDLNAALAAKDEEHKQLFESQQHLTAKLEELSAQHMTELNNMRDKMLQKEIEMLKIRGIGTRAEDMLAMLKPQVEAKSVQLNSLQQTLAAKETELRDTERELDRARAQITQKEISATEAHDAAAVASEKLHQLLETVRTLEAKLAESNLLAAERNGDAERYKAVADAASAETKTLRSQLDAVPRPMDTSAMERDLADGRSRCIELAADNERLRISSETAEKERSAAQQLRAKLSESENRAALLDGELKRLQALVTVASAVPAVSPKLTQELIDTKAELLEAKNKLVDIASKLADSQGELGRQQDALKTVRSELTDAATEGRRAKSEAAVLASELEQVNALSEAARAAAKAAQQQSKHALDALTDDLVHVRGELDSERSVHRRQVEELREDATRLKGTVDSLTRQLTDLTNQSAIASAENGMLVSKVSGLEADVRTAASERDGVLSKYRSALEEAAQVRPLKQRVATMATELQVAATATSLLEEQAKEQASRTQRESASLTEKLAQAQVAVARLQQEPDDGAAWQLKSAPPALDNSEALRRVELDLAALEAKHAGLQKQLQARAQEVYAAELENASLQNRLTSAETEFKAQGRHSVDLANRLERESRERAAVESQLAGLHADRAAAVAKAQQLRLQLARLEGAQLFKDEPARVLAVDDEQATHLRTLAQSMARLEAQMDRQPEVDGPSQRTAGELIMLGQLDDKENKIRRLQDEILQLQTQHEHEQQMANVDLCRKDGHLADQVASLDLLKEQLAHAKTLEVEAESRGADLTERNSKLQGKITVLETDPRKDGHLAAQVASVDLLKKQLFHAKTLEVEAESRVADLTERNNQLQGKIAVLENDHSTGRAPGTSVQMRGLDIDDDVDSGAEELAHLEFEQGAANLRRKAKQAAAKRAGGASPPASPPSPPSPSDADVKLRRCVQVLMVEVQRLRSICQQRTASDAWRETLSDENQHLWQIIGGVCAPGPGPPPQRRSPTKRTTRVLRFHDVQVGESRLASQLQLPSQVDLELTPSRRLSVTDSSGRAFGSWAITEIKRYGTEGDIFSVEFGHNSAQPGVLYIRAGSQTGRLFQAMERTQQL